MSTATQMNIRIPSSLKSQGDKALASIGLTPSEAVRSLWEKASKRGADLDQISRALSHQDHPATPKEQTLQQGWHIVDQFIEERGIVIDPESYPSDESLIEEFWTERYRERGLA
ncbi:MAG: hypothetical protein Q4D06_03475 [Coriobacteriia bacterium]|nr:hypothetical protein [Coriobacteriia bacterium]